MKRQIVWLRPVLDQVARGFLLGLIACCVSGSNLWATTVVADPANDAFGFDDIISISGGYTPTTLILSATFQAGTFNPNQFAFFFGLDTDLNTATGIQPPNWPVGQDYDISYNSLNSTTNAFDNHGNPVPVSFSANSLSISVPLSQIGFDDGITKFCLVTGLPLSTSSFTTLDVAPNIVSRGGAMAGPTTAAPEPSTLALAAVGLLALAGISMRRWR